MRAQQAPGAAKVRYSVRILDEQVSFIVLELADPTRRRRAGIAISNHQLMLQTVGGGWTLDIEASRLPITCYI
jgi:hypothetical protein